MCVTRDSEVKSRVVYDPSCDVVKKYDAKTRSLRGRPPKVKRRQSANGPSDDRVHVMGTSDTMESSVKRRRGRPPKAILEKTEIGRNICGSEGCGISMGAVDTNDKVEIQVKKRRGRPPKGISKEAEMSNTVCDGNGVSVTPINTNDKVEIQVKKRRGRPPKAASKKADVSSTICDDEERIRKIDAQKSQSSFIRALKESNNEYTHHKEFNAMNGEKRAAREVLQFAKEKSVELRKAVVVAKLVEKLEMHRRRAERLQKEEILKNLKQQRRERRERERKLMQELAKVPKICDKRSSFEKCQDKTDKIFVLSPCDGVIPSADLTVFSRIFAYGDLLFSRWMILEEIPSHRYGVVAYTVVERSKSATQGILYAQLTDSLFSTLPEEMFFIQTQSERDRSSMFNTVSDARFVPASDQWPSFFYAVVLSRESVSLYELWANNTISTEESGERKAWNFGTVGRLASDILEIIELAYEAGYTFRNIEMSYFRVDLMTRRLFLDNASEVVVSTELKEIAMTSGDVLLHNFWRGDAEYAPLSWHQNGNKSIMRVADCAEVLLYIILEMAGFLTWRGLHKDLIRRHKENLGTKALPPPLIEYWHTIRRAQTMDASKVKRQDGYLLLHGTRGAAASTFLDFRKLFMILYTLYIIFGDVMEEDAPYDYERFPDPNMFSPEVNPLKELLMKKESQRYKFATLKAERESITTRMEFARRIAEQTTREQDVASIIRDARIVE